MLDVRCLSTTLWQHSSRRVRACAISEMSSTVTCLRANRQCRHTSGQESEAMLRNLLMRACKRLCRILVSLVWQEEMQRGMM